MSMFSSKRVLISAYAVRPNSGSETGVGWNYIRQLSTFSDINIHLITESEFKTETESFIVNNNINIERSYISIGSLGRRLCWNQGNWLFYMFYLVWQLRVLLYVQGIHRRQRFDIMHHLNMIGFREPGFLWLFRDTKFILGPIGGYGSANLASLSKYNTNRVVLKEAIKHWITEFQISFSPRFRIALKKSEHTFCAYPEILDRIRNYSNNISILSENGARDVIRDYDLENSLRPHQNDYIVIVGKDVPRKNIDFAVEQYAQGKFDNIDLVIVGNVSRSFSIPGVVCTGAISNKDVYRYFFHAEMHWFPSLHDSNATVLIEGLSCGCPTLAFNHWGTKNYVSNGLYTLDIMNNSLEKEWISITRKIISSMTKEKRRTFAKEFVDNNSWFQLAKKVKEVYD